MALCIFALTAFRAVATNELANPKEIPPLRPPKAEILPDFWEQHGLLILIAGVGTLIALVLLWRMLSRPKPPVIPAPATIARQLLEPLREREQDKELLTEVSAILRHYFIAAFGLPAEEFTNSELGRQLASHPRTGSELSAAATDLLQGMDDLRFNAEKTGQPLTVEGRQARDTGEPAERPRHASTVEAALELIDLAERQLQPPPSEAGDSTVKA